MCKGLYHTIVIGSGSAGFGAADWLHDLGVKDVAIITEGVNMGTSRNTGSDKQTYYKLTLAGAEPDSIQEMASTLFDGGSMHGDTAYVQAACSVKAFMKLVCLGLPFPTNRYGAYVGYKTDHDPRQRATSCGPLTSKYMTEALEKEVKHKGIPVLDGYQVVKLLTKDNRIQGLAAVDSNGAYHVFGARNIVLATGGPAGIYANTVYPVSQTGGSGLAFEAGATGCNLQEWQYGLASIDFRWNVSGTYQQVLPRYISIGPEGDEREFLLDYFKDSAEALDMVFLKGYQWPFDVRKTGGSSRIDLIVAQENEKGRSVYMDFRQNPSGLDFAKLSKETFDYLEKSGALFGAPIERLAKMNPKAIKLYRDNGIDLYSEPLKVALCAQHCNGGVAVDANWESRVIGLYAVGEAAGTFGVYRPGGSALNDTQVGAMRAAEHIASRGDKSPAPMPTDFKPVEFKRSKSSNWQKKQEDIQKRMSLHAACFRNLGEMLKLYDELCLLKESFHNEVTIAGDKDLPALYKFRDGLETQIHVLSAMILSANKIGSRGSAVVMDAEQAGNKFDKYVVITDRDGSRMEEVRPLPICDDWFESVWNK